MTSAQLRQWMKTNNRTQRQLAADLGVGERTIHRWVGNDRIPRMADLAMRYLATNYRLVAPD